MGLRVRAGLGPVTIPLPVLEHMQKTAQRRAELKRRRPMPPAELLDPIGARITPAPAVLAWALETFIDDESAPTFNEDHAHLRGASIGFMWAPSTFERQARIVIGQTEEVIFRASAWAKQRQEQQMIDWFGHLPDFVITLAASYCASCSDAAFMALVEHELYHVGQEFDLLGVPKFDKLGRPKLKIRGHDVEEFVGVVRRYGVGNPQGHLSQLVRAANAGAELEEASIRHACGTCMGFA